MSHIRFGNGAVLNALIGSRQFKRACDCVYSENGTILQEMGFVGSNLYNLYSGTRCRHGHPEEVDKIVKLVESREEAIKIHGQAYIQGWLEHLMKGTVALVAFKRNTGPWDASIDLYLTNRLWIGGEVPTVVDQMWVWIIGGRAPKVKRSQLPAHHRHHAKSLHKIAIVD